MPIFKSTYNILKKPDEDEVFNPKWMDSDTLILPPKKDWDYKREMIIEDVDIWEVIFEQGNGACLYASWMPYAEFYMIIYQNQIETFYGSGAQNKIIKFLKDRNIPFDLHTKWVDDDKMWLYV